MSVIQKLIESFKGGDDSEIDLYLGNVSSVDFVRDLKEFAEESTQSFLASTHITKLFDYND